MFTFIYSLMILRGKTNQVAPVVITLMLDALTVVALALVIFTPVK